MTFLDNIENKRALGPLIAGTWVDDVLACCLGDIWFQDFLFLALVDMLFSQAESSDQFW